MCCYFIVYVCAQYVKFSPDETNGRENLKTGCLFVLYTDVLLCAHFVFLPLSSSGKKKMSLYDSQAPICPICQVLLRPGELQEHMETEIERLANICLRYTCSHTVICNHNLSQIQLQKQDGALSIDLVFFMRRFHVSSVFGAELSPVYNKRVYRLDMITGHDPNLNNKHKSP